MENKIKMENKIGKTIINQIEAINKLALSSWGAKKFIQFGNSLFFKINTPKISNGIVKITLDEVQDLYDIEVMNNRKRKLNEVKGVFWDELVFQIDLLIENKEYINNLKY